MIIRATIFDTCANPFLHKSALRNWPDGGLAILNGRVAACGPFDEVAKAYPREPVDDRRGGFLLPGLIDTHIHFPQTRVLGSFGRPLLEWLDRFALPEEAKFASGSYARSRAMEFVRALAAHGTTTALVFGSHFAGATAELFEAARWRGLRVISGLVLSDGGLRDELYVSPERAYAESKALIREYHGNGLLSYAVTPRFALSASEAMLAACGALLREEPGVRFTTHINENLAEIDAVLRKFPGSRDYLDVYERFGLVGRRSILAHNVHATESELRRLAGHDASIAHCPSSNGALGSGIFPMMQHLRHSVRFALGTDVGGGAGFGILKEGFQAYLLQRLAEEPVSLSGAQLLYLATLAGAEALLLQDEVGDFTVGKSADFVYLRPEDDSTLAAVLSGTDDPEHTLAALFMLAETGTIKEVRVAGQVVS